MTWQVLVAPFTLKQGAQYSCSLSLGFFERRLAADDLIAGKFAAAGFSNVASDMGHNRVTGTWDRPDQDNVTLPPEVTTVWEWEP